MDIRKLQRAIVDGLEDVKAQGILVFNTEQLSPLFERVVIATGASNRQTKALAASVRDAVKEAGFKVLATEGADNGEWIIVDCGAAVAHIMQPAIRDYYRLEEIWGGTPVRMKIGATGQKGLPKAAEPEPAAADAPRRAAGKKTAAGKSVPRSASTAAPAAPAKKAATKRAPAPRSAAAKAPSPARQAAAKSAAKRPAAKSPSQAARRTPAPAPAAPARKTPTRKTPARQAVPRGAAAKTRG